MKDVECANPDCTARVTKRGVIVCEDCQVEKRMSSLLTDNLDNLEEQRISFEKRIADLTRELLAVEKERDDARTEKLADAERADIAIEEAKALERLVAETSEKHSVAVQLVERLRREIADVQKSNESLLNVRETNVSYIEELERAKSSLEEQLLNVKKELETTREENLASIQLLKNQLRSETNKNENAALTHLTELEEIESRYASEKAKLLERNDELVEMNETLSKRVAEFRTLVEFRTPPTVNDSSKIAELETRISLVENERDIVKDQLKTTLDDLEKIRKEKVELETKEVAKPPAKKQVVKKAARTGIPKRPGTKRLTALKMRARKK